MQRTVIRIAAALLYLKSSLRDIGHCAVSVKIVPVIFIYNMRKIVLVELEVRLLSN